MLPFLLWASLQTPAASTLTEADLKADVATQALLSRFWSTDWNYLRTTSDANTATMAGYWNFAETLDVVIDRYSKSGDTSYRDWITKFYAAQDTNGWLNDYFDDENWMALDLISAYQATNDASCLQRATQIFEDIRTTGTADGTGASGVWWRRNDPEQVTASNAGPVITAARLALLIPERKNEYSDFALNLYDYWMKMAVDSSTFYVYDSYANGQLGKTFFTYNEGLMIGASVALYHLTADPKFLIYAEHFARYLLANETLGGILFDPCTSQGTSQGTSTVHPKSYSDCAQFKGIAFRYLMDLAEAESHPVWIDSALSANAQSVWSLAHNPETNLFSMSWTGPVPQDSEAVLLTQQSSAAMALSYAARLRNSLSISFINSK